MSDESENLIEFRCDSCSKRLKAKAKHAGRRLRCPRCNVELRIPGVNVSSGSSSNLDSSPSNISSMDAQAELDCQQSAAATKGEVKGSGTKSSDAIEPKKVPPKNSFDVDDLQLESMAITDLDDRRKLSEEIRNEKETKHRLQLAAEERRRKERKPPQPLVQQEPRKALDISFEDEYNLLPELPPSEQSRANIESILLETGNDKQGSKAADAAFDNEQSAGNSPDSGQGEQSKSIDDFGLPSLLPDFDEPKSNSSSFYDDVIEDRYRITCPICGTVQYVTVDAQGSQIKCPDCFSSFQVPKPPANWTPSKVARRHDHFDTSSPLDGDHDVRAVDKHRKQMTNALLDKAEVDLEAEKLDEDRYGAAEFDTSGFVQRTFGFLRDPVAMGFIFGYSVVFAGVFAAVQFAINHQGQGYFGKGSALLCVVVGPLMGILFGLPMISAALAQLEAVANHQPRVLDWPGFEIFENLGDLLAVAMALGMSAIPGFLVGMYLGGDAEISGRFLIAGVVFSVLLLFPIFLLSILDSGSFLGLVTKDVLRSILEVTEGWVAYYFKSTIFAAILMILWFVLLGKDKSAILAGIAGATFPLLVFFLFQQVGALADSIGEHLSFSFSKNEEQDDNRIEDLEDSI